MEYRYRVCKPGRTRAVKVLVGKEAVKEYMRTQPSGYTIEPIPTKPKKKKKRPSQPWLTKKKDKITGFTCTYCNDEHDCKYAWSMNSVRGECQYENWTSNWVQ